MRRVGYAAIGLGGVVVALVALGIGTYLAFDAMSRSDRIGLLLALPVLLIGGAAIGGVLVAGRVSRAAPVAGGALLFLFAVGGALFPGNVFSISGVGMGAVTAGPLAVVLLLGAVDLRSSRVPSGGPPPPPGAWAGPPGPGPYPPGPYPPGPAPYPAGPPPYPPGPGPGGGPPPWSAPGRPV